MERTLGELASLLKGKLKGPPELLIGGIAAIDRAGPRDITFITKKQYARLVQESRAAAFIVAPNLADLPRPLIIVPDPYLAYAQTATLFAPPLKRRPGVSNQAYLGRDVELGREVSIEPLVFIGDRVRLGDRVTIMAGCVVGDDVSLGDDTLLYPNATILQGCTVGARVIIHSGTVIGADGFGFVPTKEGHFKIPQLGMVVIEDDVELGANCTIDRAALGETRVGRGTKIDNQVQVAHNVIIGEHCLLVAQVGISGSTKLGKGVAIGGQAGLAGHLEVGDGVQIAATAGVIRSIPAGQTVIGAPARPHGEFTRFHAILMKLPEIYERLKQLERQVQELTPRPEEESAP